MRISELARRADLPVGTVKYYLRERLVPAGEPTSATQALYNHEHVARLRLVRALLGVGGLSVSTAREILAVIDDPSRSALDRIGAAHGALPGGGSADVPDLDEAREHLRRWGWQVRDDSPALIRFAQGLEGLRAAEFDTTPALLDRYARAAAELAEADVDEVPAGSPDEAVRFVVIGTVLLEPILLALRRLAQQDASVRRSG